MDKIPPGHSVEYGYKTIEIDVFNDRSCCKLETLVFWKRKGGIDFYECSVCKRRWAKDNDGKWKSAKFVSKRYVKNTPV